MSWANCGEDSKGRPIGYAHEGTCDHPGCEAIIDRGLAFACGDMHGDGVYSCEGYFCHVHLMHAVVDGETPQLCQACYADLPEWAREQGLEQCPMCEAWVWKLHGEGDERGCSKCYKECRP